MTDSPATAPEVLKFCFAHPASNRKFLIGAYDKEGAIAMMEEMVQDKDFIEIDVPKEYL